MILRFLTPYLTPLLLAVVAVLGASAAWQTYRLERAQTALSELQQSITTAQQQSELRAATSGQEAVSTYVQAQERDAPIVERVVTRTRNVCLQQPAARDLSVPAATGGAGPAGRQAQDDADRAAWVSAVAEDLRTCASELARLDAIRAFHNANVGLAP